MSSPRFDLMIDVALRQMGAECSARSNHWFPAVHESAERLLQHLAMGVAEEGGEVLGVVKKWGRFPLDFATLDREKLHGEMCDLLTYLSILGDLTEIDWNGSLETTLQKCIDRWGEPS